MSASLRHVVPRRSTTRVFITYKSRLECMRRYYSTRRFGKSETIETDECAIPLQPTWSVNDLLSSYPKPSISPSQLKHLHELSALLPPEEDSTELASLTAEMENLVKLVEAVRIPDLQGEEKEAVPDGRVWADGMGIELTESVGEVSAEEIRGRDLLAWPYRTSNGMYVVDTDRRRK
ncbi:hypothetical protein NEOLEDRAFT_1131492 [Neolentinus lepideus HHB14362 ss-1]|uniref:Uncharacterized protein n=1 Tax=Neolentinus lepideus HHB14362 ss-1 TaxID=1314782 RepID=A0A165TPV2_9AGAM|nr:hypothetical protein NEOLEDRAFT_1131492 [Neolentinus lepideus HHB14362 ss-1]